MGEKGRRRHFTSMRFRWGSGQAVATLAAPQSSVGRGGPRPRSSSGAAGRRRSPAITVHDPTWRPSRHSSQEVWIRRTESFTPGVPDRQFARSVHPPGTQATRLASAAQRGRPERLFGQRIGQEHQQRLPNPAARSIRLTMALHHIAISGELPGGTRRDRSTWDRIGFERLIKLLIGALTFVKFRLRPLGHSEPADVLLDIASRGADGSTFWMSGPSIRLANSPAKTPSRPPAVSELPKSVSTRS